MTKLKNLLALLIAFGVASCASVSQAPQGGEQPDLVFPSPPNEARFIYERTIRGSADIEQVGQETRWRRLLTGETATSAGLSKPFDVVVCQGRIYVSDTVARTVFLFDVPSGEFSEIGIQEPGQLDKPLGMAVDEECNLYVADGTASRVVIYDQDGQYISAIGGNEMFDRLSHVEVDQSGQRIYCVDTGGVSSDRHHVRVFDTDSGEHLFDIGLRGTQSGELNLARDVALGPDGNLYVVDGGNFRVQVFDPDGEFIRQIGAIGVRTGQFSRPKGIDTDAEGNVYVSDAAFGNFQIFSPQGELLLFIGDRSETEGAAKFLLPGGLAVDEDGRVYMVDQFFRKVDVFRPISLGAGEGFLAARKAIAE